MQGNNYNHRPNPQTRGFQSEISVVDEVAKENVIHEPTVTIMLGVVADCSKLNVREDPSVDADVVCEIPKRTEVMINDDESTDDFYKVCTDSGIEGFCMKRYIAVRQ